MDFTITIGEAQFPGRLPFIPTRLQIVGVVHDAGQRAARKRARAKDGPIWEYALGHCAALGACWAGELDCRSLRECEYQVAEYGEGVLDALLRRGLDYAQVLTAAREVYVRLLESIPTEKEVASAAAPFGDRAAPSTRTS